MEIRVLGSFADVLGGLAEKESTFVNTLIWMAAIRSYRVALQRCRALLRT